MQTISARYLSATNYKGARVVASTTSGVKLTIPWDHEKDPAGNYATAAAALRDSLGWWRDEMIGGDTKDGMIFVFVSAGSAHIPAKGS
jgi:hypothetical protein